MKKLFDIAFDTFGGKLMAAGVVMLGLVAAWQADRYFQRQQGEKNAVAKINDQAVGLTRKARKAVDSVPADGNAERLRNLYCGDC